jgi:hypothetical protein
MTDAQRYRMNAAECLSAAERCESPYRGLTLAIAASWLSLARRQTAMDELLAIRLGGFMQLTTVTRDAPQHVDEILSPREPAVASPRRRCSAGGSRE